MKLEIKIEVKLLGLLFNNNSFSNITFADNFEIAKDYKIIVIIFLVLFIILNCL